MGCGFFGIAMYHPKNIHNWGSLMRSANIMGVNFIATIGRRFPKQASDTLKTYRHLPIFEFSDFDDFKSHLPFGCQLIGIELVDDAKLLEDFQHPQQACYLLGAEDMGLPKSIINQCHKLVKLQGKHSMNVSCAGSIVMYHRKSMRGKK